MVNGGRWVGGLTLAWRCARFWGGWCRWRQAGCGCRLLAGARWAGTGRPLAGVGRVGCGRCVAGAGGVGVTATSAAGLHWFVKPEGIVAELQCDSLSVRVPWRGGRGDLRGGAYPDGVCDRDCGDALFGGGDGADVGDGGGPGRSNRVRDSQT